MSTDGKTRVYDVLATAFMQEGVRDCFALLGDANMNWAARLAQQGCRMVYVRHEHCALAAAMAYSRKNWDMGVATVTCGPGVTQLITALPAAVRAHLPLVVFAGESFTQCPITSDHKMLIAQIYGIRGGFMADGTAIGSGLATSVDRLRSSTSKSRVVVLLTDGENNGGLIDPKTAKEIAKSLGIKVYTIGVGTEGFAPTPVQTPGGIVMQQEKVNIDEKLLTEIAKETGGKYFRARDNESLKNIYTEIDALEKTKIEINTTRKYTEKFYPLAFLALLFLLLEVFFRYTVFRKFP